MSASASTAETALVVEGSVAAVSGRRRPGRTALVAAAAGLALGFVAVGLFGAERYGWNYWLYRGFDPPRDPAFVLARGRSERFYVRSTALGGRSQPVDVYLPPGYASSPHERYPVVYLLHGFPGRPGAFLRTVRAGVVEDILLARRRVRPFLLVMPFGSTGTFTDEEWANGVRPHSGWETFVARDLVRAVDRRYRTIPDGAHRALAGLSEGGYGALNIGLHHPGEFRVLESWSGYERAARIRSIFGTTPGRLTWNSPVATLPAAAPALRRARTFVCLYSGSTDPFRGQNQAFAAELAARRIAHRFRLVRGGHNWAIWRAEAANALLAAARHLGAQRA
jgi:enterochelin esterase-like enzyme